MVLIKKLAKDKYCNSLRFPGSDWENLVLENLFLSTFQNNVKLEHGEGAVTRGATTPLSGRARS